MNWPEKGPPLWRELSARQITYYREMLLVHVDDELTHACRICRVSRCADWRTAYETLTAAGELLTDLVETAPDETVEGYDGVR